MNRKQKVSTKAAQSQRRLSPSTGQNGIEIYNGFYGSLDELLTANITETEEIFYGVNRGQVAQIVSVTNVGKSTLMLNVSLALASGQECPPLVHKPSKPRRVLYVDFEATAAELREDMEKMILVLRNPDLARKNFIPVVGASINKHPLNLSNSVHMDFLIRRSREVDADLIVIDPVSLAFSLTDENSNAEVIERVVRPLKRLAVRTTAAIVFSHHIGKQYESSSEGAYQGRGASALGGLARTVFNINSVQQLGYGYVKLWCSKSKRGRPFRPVILRLNDSLRWFELSEEEALSDESLSAEDIAKHVASKEPNETRTAEIYAAFKHLTSKTTFKRLLNAAVTHGLIMRVGHGRYRRGDNYAAHAVQAPVAASASAP
jgi:KaiC/GvpD/RAD55 family RecA-like ATPase